MPSVSVIVPVYNGVQFLEDVITALQNQTFKDFEVIFVDDGSTDLTLPTLKHLQKITNGLEIIISSIPHKGLSSARNEGIRLARGKYISFLDCDDSWYPNKLQIQVAALDDNDFGAVFSNVIYLQDSIETLNHMVNLNSEIRSPKQLLNGNSVIFGGGSNILCRSKILNEVGGFNERLRYVEDLDMWLRLSELTSILELPETTVKINLRTDSMQRIEKNSVQIDLLRSKLLVYQNWFNLLDKSSFRFLIKEMCDSIIYRLRRHLFSQLFFALTLWGFFFFKWFNFHVQKQLLPNLLKKIRE
jgi:glycosyltransferase involved in cell wall biosynthesis